MPQFNIEYMKELYLFSFNIHSTFLKYLQVLNASLQGVLSSAGEIHKQTKKGRAAKTGSRKTKGNLPASQHRSGNILILPDFRGVK